jgi:cysteinyl-tRNA synthetase
MATHVFNTLTGIKEPFAPLTAGRVKMYVCGPTVYDDPHLGHARSAVVYDVVRRWFKAKGYTVTYVRNVTDIDDKIIEKATRQNQDFRKLGARYTSRYGQAMMRLNVLPPDVEPKVTDFMLPIQEFIAKLMHTGHAYRSGGNVYFAVTSFKGYGKLSGRNVQALPADDQVPPETGKRHPADFALWKESKAQEPSWPSPWGYGRPGWHIECSAMSAALLGEVFDIHGGGADLIFPHHENEIAQSQSLFAKTPANYWMHNGLVQVNGEKMSKSLGNNLKLIDLLDVCLPDTIRLLMLSKRYRHPVYYSQSGLNAAARSAVRLQRLFGRPDMPSVPPTLTGLRHGNLWSQFCHAMDDDFNFPRALAVVFEGVRQINRCMQNASSARAMEDVGDLRLAIANLHYLYREVLGFGIEPCAAVPNQLLLEDGIGIRV